jgi:hypothetical protein
MNTPRLYLTPHLKKRKDGMSPSFLELGAGNSVKPGATKESAGGTSKPYRTSSDLLLQIKERHGVRKEDAEIPALVEAVNEAIGELVGPDEDLRSVEFAPSGCTWRVEFNPSLNEADENYCMEVTLYANHADGTNHYLVDTVLACKGEPDPNPLAPPLKGYREAKQAFELLSLKVRKAVVRFEFPDFPEGCKGRAFREVYQLNARVRVCCLCCMWRCVLPDGYWVGVMAR